MVLGAALVGLVLGFTVVGGLVLYVLVGAEHDAREVMDRDAAERAARRDNDAAERAARRDLDER
jgi:uncharacterized membrane protein